MKIAVVGCGAVGSYYGAMLGRDGHDTHFLLRSDYAAVRRNGVLVRSVNGDFRVQPKPARTPKDLILSSPNGVSARDYEEREGDPPCVSAA